MIRHFFKLTWNKKKRHLLLVIELFLAYLVMCFLVIFLSATKFFREKSTNFNVDNMVEIWTSNDTVKQNISAIREVQGVSLTDFSPYNNIVTNDSLEYGDKEFRIYKWSADEHLQSILNLPVVSGRWFNAQDRSTVKKPVVLTEGTKENLFHAAKAEGKIIKVNSMEYTVIGVTKNMNDPTGNYKKRTDLFVLDTGNLLLVKLKVPLSDNIYRKLRRETSQFQNEFSDLVTPVKQNQDKYMSRNNVLTYGVGGLSCFLIVNVILGLFSILYQNINRRKPEIGVRRSAGATAAMISRQIVLEVVFIATIALIPGLIVAYQFALFQVFGAEASYSLAMAIGAIVIYILVVLCALYPAKLASQIQPAMALHEE